MDMRRYYANPGEMPLDNIKPDGGFTSIFRTIACIGDNISPVPPDARYTISHAAA